MIVNFRIKVASVKVPDISGQPAQIVEGIEVDVTTEIKAEEFSAYTEVVKAQVAALGEMMSKGRLDLS